MEREAGKEGISATRNGAGNKYKEDKSREEGRGEATPDINLKIKEGQVEIWKQITRDRSIGSRSKSPFRRASGGA